jgi:hypothetical protein
MVVMETTKGARILIRSDAVRMIEEDEDAALPNTIQKTFAYLPVMLTGG